MTGGEDHRHRVTWGVYALVCIAGFSYLEARSIIHRRPTLTATMRYVMGIDPKDGSRRAWRGLFLAFWVWVVIHIYTSWA